MIGGFDYAIKAVKNGAKIRRTIWPPATYVVLQVWSNGSKMTGSYLFVEDGNGSRVPWIPSYSDMLADDWGAD